MRILGLDPGLGTTGWGLIQAEGNRLSHIANGQLKTDSSTPLPQRLASLGNALEAVIADHRPDSAAVEEVFVNANPQSTLKLGQARGVVIMTAARAGLDIGEYAARLVKKAVVGVGNAEKTQVHAMVARLLPGVKIAGPDAADALAVAIPPAHHWASGRGGIPRKRDDRPPLRNPRRDDRRRSGDRRRGRRVPSALQRPHAGHD